MRVFESHQPSQKKPLNHAVLRLFCLLYQCICVQFVFNHMEWQWQTTLGVVSGAFYL